jgi:hypothetical protein
MFCQGEIAHGDGRGKRPRDEGSSRSGGSPPPRWMMMGAGANWIHASGR